MKRRVVNVFEHYGTLYAFCDDQSLWYRGTEMTLPAANEPFQFSSSPRWLRVDLSEVEDAE